MAAACLPRACQAYSKPPPLVEAALSGVMTVLKRPATWEEAKKQLGEPSFMSKLLAYDKVWRAWCSGQHACLLRSVLRLAHITAAAVAQDNMDEPLLKRLAKLMSAPDFTPAAVGKVSTAARGMCMWVRAMEVYGNVARDVAPKRARLRAVQDALRRKQAALAAAQEAHAAITAKATVLRDR